MGLSKLYAKSLHIYDFRCFGQAVLELRYPSRPSPQPLELDNVNLILGDNASGKSSVLRALAIAVLAPALLGSGFVPYRLVRRPNAKAALIKVRAVLESVEKQYRTPRSNTQRRAGQRNEVELLARLIADRRGNRDRIDLRKTPPSPIKHLIQDDYSSAFFLAGYGATRRVEVGDFSESSARKSRGLRYQRVAGLFEDHVTLRPLQSWLPRIKAEALRSAVIAQITKVLPKNIEFDGTFDDKENQYIFTMDGQETPFSSLSDGYKAFIGWVSDLIGHLCDISKEDELALDAIPGMVLVDEIDLHLHPEWQRHVVPMVAHAFPKIQFVFTSHSPLVASTVRRQNIFVSDTAEDRTATIKQLQETVHGKSAEHILLSSYFGLTTTRAASFQDEAERLFTRAAKGDKKAAMQYLTKLSAPIRKARKEVVARAKGSRVKASGARTTSRGRRKK